jgi:hypothetical protein
VVKGRKEQFREGGKMKGKDIQGWDWRKGLCTTYNTKKYREKSPVETGSLEFSYGTISLVSLVWGRLRWQDSS